MVPGLLRATRLGENASVAGRDDRKLNLTEAARELGLSRRTLSRAAKDGRLTTHGEGAARRVSWKVLRRAPLYTAQSLVGKLAVPGSRRAAEVQRTLNSLAEGGEIRSVDGRFCWDDKERLALELALGKARTREPTSAVVDAELDRAFLAWLRGEIQHPGEIPKPFWDEPQSRHFVPPIGIFRYEVIHEHRNRCKCIRSRGIAFDNRGQPEAVDGKLVEMSIAEVERANRHWDRLEQAWDKCWEHQWESRAQK